MNKRFYTVLSNLLVPLGGLSTDIYLPSLPHMAPAFHTSDAAIQLTITTYLLAMGLAQFIAGPVSDALGRKRLIGTALIVQLLTVIGIITAQNVETIILMRFFQGLAAAFMIVPARALLNDNFEGTELKKKYNYLTISFAMAPIIAPFIGGYCEQYFGWQASFYVLLVYIIAMMIMVFGYSEETIRQQRPFSAKDIVGNYRQILKQKSYIYPTILISVMMGYTSLINVLGPFIFQEKLGLSAVEYGYIALLIGLAWFLGNVVNQMLFEASSHKKVMFALICQTVMVAVMFLLAGSGEMTVLNTLIPIFVLVFSAALVFPIFIGECLAKFPTLAASSNAFLFASTWVAFALYTLLATQLSVTTLYGIIIVYLVINLISYGLYQIIQNTDKPALD